MSITNIANNVSLANRILAECENDEIVNDGYGTVTFNYTSNIHLFVRRDHLVLMQDSHAETVSERLMNLWSSQEVLDRLTEIRSQIAA